jgi:hypothetical protein
MVYTKNFCHLIFHSSSCWFQDLWSSRSRNFSLVSFLLLVLPLSLSSSLRVYHQQRPYLHDSWVYFIITFKVLVLYLAFFFLFLSQFFSAVIPRFSSFRFLILIFGLINNESKGNFFPIILDVISFYSMRELVIKFVLSQAYVSTGINLSYARVLRVLWTNLTDAS